jgi:hypothetical protein
MDGFRLYGLIAACLAGAVVIVAYLMSLAPPKQISIAAGRDGGAYYALAERYAAILARDGLTLRIVQTEGSVENARLLTTGKVDVALVQGGVPLEPGDMPIEALGSLFLEPVLVFHGGRLGATVFPPDWEGLRIAVGKQGSGARQAIGALGRHMGFDPSVNTLLPLGGSAAAEALLDGEADVAVFVAPLDAPYLSPLLGAEGIVMAEIENADALAATLPYAVVADLAPGVIDYARRIPARPIRLLATPARMMVREKFHPALVERLVHMAEIVHAPRTPLSLQGAFPSSMAVDAPMNGQALRLLGQPPNPLHRVLPYWIVAQINKFALLLLPVLFLLPTLYAWQMRSRVYRHYLDLRHIDMEAGSESDPVRLQELAARLNRIEEALRRQRLPLSYREKAYLMRQHIDLVRRRIRDQQREAAGERQPA